MAKVMVSLPEEFLRRVDRAARAQNRSRSELIREALRAMLDVRTGRFAWHAALTSLTELEQQWVGQWDSADIIRYYRDRRYGREARR